MSTGTVKVSEVFFDYTIYPRHKLSDYHVNQLMEAKLGGANFPPIVLDQKSKRIIDGFHRATAYKKLYGLDYETKAEFIDCKDEKELVKLSIDYNIKHGLPLSTWDKKRCMQLMASLQIDMIIQQNALMLTKEKYEKLEKDLVEIRSDVGKVIGHTQLKRGQKSLAEKENGKYVTQEEAKIIESGSTTGMSSEVRITTLIKDFSLHTFRVTKKNIKRVRELYELIGNAILYYEEEDV
jgi:hypothetical protein